MLLYEVSLGFVQRDSFAAIGLPPPAADSRERLGTFQATEHVLVALCILDNEFGATVHGQHKRSLLLSRPT